MFSSRLSPSSCSFLFPLCDWVIESRSRSFGFSVHDCVSVSAVVTVWGSWTISYFTSFPYDCLFSHTVTIYRQIRALTDEYAFLIRILQFITLCWFIFVIWDVSKKWICPSGWSFMNQSAKSSCAHNRCALFNRQCDQPITGTQKYRLSSRDFYGCNSLFPPQ